MSVLIEFPGGLREPTLSEMVQSQVRMALAGPPQDRLAAQNHEQKLNVGLGYVTRFLMSRDGNICCPDGGSPRSFNPSDIVGLDPYVIAEQIESDARPEDKAGIARTVGILIGCAREVLEKTAAQDNPSIRTGSMPSRRSRKLSSTNSRISTVLSTHPGARRKKSNQQFPLEAYCAVYQWIDDWSRIAKDRELRAIARSASKSLHAVGTVLLETMRSMRSGAKLEDWL